MSTCCLGNMFPLMRKSTALMGSRNIFKHCRLLSMYNSNTFLNVMGDTKLPITSNNDIKRINPTPTYDLPPMFKSHFEIYDSIPFLDINLPMNTQINNKTNLILPYSNEKEVLEPELENKEKILCKHGMLKIRRKKMNKHKYQKRKKRDRAKLRKLFLRKRKIQEKKRKLIKKELIKKIEKIEEEHPQSTYAERPYVVHRLTNW